MFFGGSSHFSSSSADSCLPDVSACAGMVGSRGIPPKLSPLFRSENHVKQHSNFNSQVSATKALFALSPAKSAHPQNAPATPVESALPFLLDLKPTRINTYEKILRRESDGLCSLAQRVRSSFVAPTCPEFGGVSREFRRNSERPSGAPLVFLGAPLFARHATSGNQVRTFSFPAARCVARPTE